MHGLRQSPSNGGQPWIQEVASANKISTRPLKVPLSRNDGAKRGHTHTTTTTTTTPQRFNDPR